MTPIADAHFCTPPATADLYGRELDWTCWQCGAWLLLEHYWIEGEMVGPAWDLLWSPAQERRPSKREPS